MAAESNARRIIATERTEFLPYDLDGPLQPDIGWLPISFDRKKGEGSYLMRMQPGTRHNSRTEIGCLIAVFEWRPGKA